MSAPRETPTKKANFDSPLSHRKRTFNSSALFVCFVPEGDIVISDTERPVRAYSGLIIITSQKDVVSLSENTEEKSNVLVKAGSNTAW